MSPSGPAPSVPVVSSFGRRTRLARSDDALRTEFPRLSSTEFDLRRRFPELHAAPRLPPRRASGRRSLGHPRRPKISAGLMAPDRRSGCSCRSSQTLLLSSADPHPALRAESHCCIRAARRRKYPDTRGLPVDLPAFRWQFSSRSLICALPGHRERATPPGTHLRRLGSNDDVETSTAHSFRGTARSRFVRRPRTRHRAQTVR